MIVIDHISKRYGQQVAVDDLTFAVKPGVVTGFLGPNGAGKSTTMRMIIGLDRPDSGQITIDGRRYAEHRAPIHEVGALLDAKAVHPARSARNHADSNSDRAIVSFSVAPVVGVGIGEFAVGGFDHHHQRHVQAVQATALSLCGVSTVLP